ncbi:MAG: T9SS type A sorting domain-containing protein [candidate division Zixibacteria bacterium]|nr:T9SS type A sorting domain-containing protein [candidate division Zixibacteria bacterium]
MKKIFCLIAIVMIGLSSAASAEWTPYSILNSPLETDYISSLEVDPDGKILIGSQGLGLYVKDGDNWDIYNQLNTDVPIDYTYSLAFSADTLFLGSASGNLDTQPLGEGLSVLNLSDSTWSELNYGLGISPIITGIEIADQYRAVSTYGGGITIYDDTGWIRYQTNFRTEFTYADSQQQTFYVYPGTYIPTDYIRGLDYDSQNDILWIATLNGGAVAYTGGQWQTYDMSNTGLPSNRIQLIKADPNNSAVYFGTFGFGLARKIGDDWTVFNTGNSPLVANYIHSLEVRPDNGDLWVGTNYAINVITPEDEWSSIIPPDTNLVWGDFYSDIAFDSSGNVWASTFGGGIASKELVIESEPEPEEDSLYVDVKKLKFLLREPRRHNVTWIRANLEPTVELFEQDSISITVNSDLGQVYGWESVFGNFYHLYSRRNIDIYAAYVAGSAVVLKYFNRHNKIRLYLLDWNPDIDIENMANELDIRIKLGSYVGHDYVYIGEADPISDPDTDTLATDPGDILYSIDNDPIITDIDDEQLIPELTSIPINYPNPFNPYTSISFSIVQPGQVNLTVYDVMGRVVSVDRRYLNTGNHSISWDGTNKASGVYYYAIRCESGTQTGSMTLLK